MSNRDQTDYSTDCTVQGHQWEHYYGGVECKNCGAGSPLPTPADHAGDSYCTTTHRAARSIEPGDLTSQIDGQTVRLGNPTAPCTCTDRESDRLKCDRVGHGVPCDEDAEKWNRAIVQGDVNRAGIPHVDGIFVGDRVVLLTSAYYDARVIDLFGSRVRVAYQAGTVWATPWDRKASRGTRRLVSARK